MQGRAAAAQALGIPGRQSCSSLCQQIPFNSLLMLVLAVQEELQECRAGIAELELQRMLMAQGVEDCRLPQPALLLRSGFVLLKWTEPLEVEWVFLSPHTPFPSLGFSWLLWFD